MTGVDLCTVFMITLVVVGVIALMVWWGTRP